MRDWLWWLLPRPAGRGRRDHSFFSPPDSGLYLSFLLRPDLSARDALSLTTCAAASVALAIEECAGVDAKIKWVNDVFCHGKKVCGILTEAALDLETGGLQYAIVGIGVNLFPPKGGFPPELPEAGAVFPTRPQGLEGRSQLAGSILNHFFSFYPHLKDKPFFADYRRRSLVLGQEITVLEGGQTRTAFALTWNGISPSGSGKPTAPSIPYPPGRFGSGRLMVEFTHFLRFLP